MSEAAYEVHVDIASSNYPHFDINTNSGEPFGASQRLIVAETGCTTIGDAHPRYCCRWSSSVA